LTRILFLPKYPRLGASSRLRTYQYIPLWEREGVEVKVSSFFNEKYLNQIYAHQKPSYLNALKCYLNRFFILFSVKSYDLIWIEKELFPFLPSYGEWIFNKMGIGYLVDYDDAVFHNYDLNKRPLIRFWMGNKIDWVMRNANLVWAGNQYIASRAEKAGAGSIAFLPTVIDPARYSRKIWKEKPIVSIGWIGSPSTLRYLRSLIPVLNKLDQDYNIKLIVVNGTVKTEFSGKQVLVPWSEESEVESIHLMDIGLMPLPDNHWERGKCAYKLIQYMACGLPVVASPVGMNSEVVKHGENGFLAKTDEEWFHFLSQLIGSLELRKEMGQKGFEHVQENYTLERNFIKIQKHLSQLKLL